MHPSRLFGGSPFGRRLSRPGAGRIPATVVTGFLGAGKTTLIRAALARPGAERTAVIVNEFAEAGIDDVLLATATEDVTLIGNGCICCAARNDLHRALRTLFADRERGAVPPFDRVVVETSGLSAPGPILQSFATDRTVCTTYSLEGLVTVVDAVLAARSRREPVWTEQVVLADRLVLTKTDLADQAQLAEARALLAALNPEAEVAESADVRADPAFLFGTTERTRSALACLPESAAAPAADGHERFVLEFDAPFDWGLFTRVMGDLTAARGEDLLRVKGFVDVEGCAGPVLVQYVQHLAAPPEELVSWPGETRCTRLVFITRDVSREAVSALFSAHLGLLRRAPAQEAAPRQARA